MSPGNHAEGRLQTFAAKTLVVSAGIGRYVCFEGRKYIYVADGAG
jgi:hypothetical protein